MGNSSNKSKKPETNTNEKQQLSLKNSFVISRKGSMYFDEDGDLAHEFYIEIPSTTKGLKSTMQKTIHNLKPQGEVDYKYPRLHVNFPMILYQMD